MGYLTERQREILQCAFDCDGDLHKVAELKSISHGTVRNHFHIKIFDVLMVNSLCGAFRVGLALGLIDLGKSLDANTPQILLK